MHLAARHPESQPANNLLIANGYMQFLYVQFLHKADSKYTPVQQICERAAGNSEGGYPAWIRTKNNASKGRCVTVTPRGTRISGLDSRISPPTQFPKCIRLTVKTPVRRSAIRKSTLFPRETLSNSQPKLRLNEWRCSQIVVAPWPTRPVMERTTFLKNY